MRAEDPAFLSNLFVTEAGIIFVSDLEERKVFALHPGSPTFTEVWKCPGGLYPQGLLVHERSLYVWTSRMAIQWWGRFMKLCCLPMFSPNMDGEQGGDPGS